MLERAVATVTELVEANLIKLAEQRAKAEVEALARKDTGSSVATPSEVSTLKGANVEPKPSLMLRTHTNHSQLSDISDDNMEEIE